MQVSANSGHCTQLDVVESNLYPPAHFEQSDVVVHVRHPVLQALHVI